MKKLFLITIVLGVIALTGRAQTWIIDDFNAAPLDTTWHVTGSTFAISLENNALRVDYNRLSGGSLWDQFHWKANQEISVSSYKLTFKLKSNVNFKLNVKPVFADGSDDWLEKEISTSGTFQEVEFEVVKNNQITLETIYIYFDGGSATSKSGIVFLDDIAISGTIVTQQLLDLTENAETFLANINISDYPSANISVFQRVVDDAILVLASPESQEQVDSTLEELYSAFSEMEASYIIPAKLEGIKLADSTPSKQTLALYYNLKDISATQFLFGHQDATGYGVGWQNDNSRSDVESVCGSYPALAGWGLSEIAKGNEDAGAVYRAKKFYNMGAVNTFEWHMDNPFGGDFYWGNRQTDDLPVPAMLPGGEKNEFYKTQLRNIAAYFRSLRGNNGESVPVIFRPFHEHTGNWFWWGEAHCSADDYKNLWQFTVEYMRDSLKLHNIIYAYSPDQFTSDAQYLERYPGDDYVDILGFDDYWNLRDASGKNAFVNELGIVGKLAESKGKICAVTETGLETISYNTWFSERLLNPVLTNEKTKRIAYVMVWRNASTSHFYAPYSGHTSTADFINFYNNPATLFVNDKLPALYEVEFSTGITIPNIEKDNLIIYPNPTTGTIKIKNVQEANIRLFGLDGGIIEQAVVFDGTYTVPDVVNGSYLLVVTTRDGTTNSSKIFIKN